MFSLPLMLTLTAAAQWGPSGCPAPPLPAQFEQPVVYQWRRPTNGDTKSLWLVRPQVCHGTYCEPEQLIGGYNVDAQEYRPFEPQSNTWGAVESLPPFAPGLPLGKPPKKQPLPTGVVQSKIHDSPSFSHSGIRFTAEEAKAALTDDSTLPYLTVIGDKTNWRSVLDAFPADFKSEVRLKCFPPDHWAVKKFAPKTAPCVLLQQPDGHILAREEPFKDAATFLAALHPAPPSPPTPVPTPTPDSSGNTSLWLLLAGALLYLFYRRS